MKTLLPFVFLVCSQLSYGQKGANYHLLENILRAPYVKVFKLDVGENKDIPIMIVDTAKFFKAGKIQLEDGRVAQIVHEAAYLENRINEILVLYVTPRRKQRYHIDLYSRSSHGICSVDVQDKRGEIYWTRIKCGTLD